MARSVGSKKTPIKVIELLRDEVARTSQAATARATGLTLKGVQNYLKGIGEPTTATLEKLSAYFGVSVLKLRGDSVFDQMTAHDYYHKFTSMVDVFLSLALKSKLLEKNRSFLLAAVSMAKLITEMPIELQENYDSKYLSEVKNLAENVIKKYSGVDLFERYMPPTSKTLVRKRGHKAKSETVPSPGVTTKKTKTK